MTVPRFLVFLLFASPLLAQTRYPYIDAVYPVAVSRGAVTEVEIETTGSVKTAYKALVEGVGIRAEVVKRTEEMKLPDNRARVRLEVAADAPLGSRDIRLVTEEAITTVARLQVTDLKAVLEKAPHGTRAEAQEIELPCLVNGRVAGSVEVDWYRFPARKGERATFNLIGARLHDTIHHVGRFTPHFDGFLALFDGEGRELASSDDHYFADPLLSFEFPADGVYSLAIREANYKGHASYTYALMAVRGPFPAITLPLAAPPGKATPVDLIGPGHVPGPGSRAEVTLPAEAAPGRVHLFQDLLLLSSLLPPSRETEKPGETANDDPASAQAVMLPAGIAGTIGKPDDRDCYSFQAAKGASYRFEVFARRLFGALDSDLAVLDPKGSVLASGDDGRDLAGRTVKDSLLTWTAPADGTYLVRVQDLHQRGGPDFVYHLECAPAEPGFELSFDPEISMIGPGNRSPVYVRAHRRNGFAGEIALEVEGLPAGVKALAPPILPGMTDACVVFQAAADAPRDGSIFSIRGRAARDGAEALVRTAVPLVEIYQAQRVEGRTGGVAVTRPSDIEVTTPVTELYLKPGESKEIPIKLVRGQYKSGPVTLWAMWRYEGSIFGSSLPPGVTVNEGESRTSLNGEAVEGRIVLTAAPDAKPVPGVRGVQTVVIGLVPIEFSVFVPYCTPPIQVGVAGKDGAVAAAQ